jgi:hypothetical protein
MAWAIQVSFLGSQGDEFFGKAGNLRGIEPIYEPPNGGVLVGAVVHIARPLIPVLGIPCIPAKRFMVTYPLSAKQDEGTQEWSTYIPVEVFKPSLEKIIWAFNNHINLKVCIQGNIFGHESYSTENQRLNDALISKDIMAQFVYERAKKLQTQVIRIGMDVWEGEVKLPVKRQLELSKEIGTIVSNMAPRYSGIRGRAGKYPNDTYPMGESVEMPIDGEGEIFPQTEKKSGSKWKFWERK